MYSDADTLKGWVAPFGHLGINACSRLPQDFRSVPRPSSPPGAKASTRCPSHTQNTAVVANGHLAQEPSQQIAPLRCPHCTHTHTLSSLNTAAGSRSAPPEETSSKQTGSDNPRKPRHGHTPAEPLQTSDAQPHTQPPKRPPELSCASRDATEPDSRSTKNPNLNHTPRSDLRRTTPPRPNTSNQPINRHNDTTWRRHPGDATLETIGIEPMTPCLQSRCSPS